MVGDKEPVPKPYESDMNLFDGLFGESGLGGQTERARSVYINYGRNLQVDVLNVLLYSRDQERVGEVLDRLEEHQGTHLAFQHPEARGRVLNDLGIDETAAFFEDVCKNTLGLTPSES